MDDLIEDRWAAESPASGSLTSSWTTRAIVLLSGAVVPVLSVIGDGPSGRWGALVIVSSCALLITGLSLARIHPRAGSGLSIGSVLVALIGIPWVGRAPMVLMVVATMITDIAIVDSIPTSWHRRWSPGPAVAALPFLYIGELNWLRTGSLVVVTASVGLAALIAILHRIGPRWFASVSECLGRAATTTGSALGTAILAVVAVPTLYIPGAVASATRLLLQRRIRWDDPRSNWITADVPGSSSDWRRDADRPFRSAPRAVRRRRNLVGALMIVLVAAGTAWARTERTTPPTPAPTVAAAARTGGEESAKASIASVERFPYSQRPAFRNDPDADALQQEFARIHLVPGPVGDYGVGDFNGHYFNVTAGARESIQSNCNGCPRARVWLVGGSAVFGTGQRDDHTIASELVRRADVDHIALDVVNLGVPGWTLWQEYQGILARLSADSQRPDMVIVLDGYNDVIATMATSIVTGLDPLKPTTLDSKEVIKTLAFDDKFVSQIDGSALGAAMAHRYAGLQRLIAEQLEAIGVHTAFFFQPDALASQVQRQAIEVVYAGNLQSRMFPATSQALEEASTSLRPGVTDLRHLFDDTEAPVFFDTVHTNEAGASMIAAAIYSQVATTLHRSAG